MRYHGPAAITVIIIVLSGCADLTAVGNFAKESSLITSNKAMLDDTAAQTEARTYAHTHQMVQIESSLVDPSSKEFTDRLAVTKNALDALNAYMTVLGQLAAKGVPSVSPNVSTIESALTSLKVTDPVIKPSLDATTALANIVLDAIVRKDVAKLIKSSASSVDQVTMYLADQAQTAANTYTQAAAFNDKYWSDLTRQTDKDKEFCASAGLCTPLYVLATRARDSDDVELAAKAKAATAAVTAFQKIRADNAALVANADHLNADALIETLKADEPDLLTAIRNLQTL
jgi:hypothetical protein